MSRSQRIPGRVGIISYWIATRQPVLLASKIRVPGIMDFSLPTLFVPGSEKFVWRTFVPWNFRLMELSLPVMKVKLNTCSLGSRNTRSVELSFYGTSTVEQVTRNFCSNLQNYILKYSIYTMSASFNDDLMYESVTTSCRPILLLLLLLLSSTFI